MTDRNHCMNPHCGCPATSSQVCCSDCALESEELMPSMCGCGHLECEPKGFELEADREELAAGV